MTEQSTVGRPVAATPVHIMVLVGTDVHPFDRLVDWVERYDANGTDLRWSLQYGASRPSSLDGSSSFLDRSTLRAGLTDAHVVVCHGGPATITEARAAGHIPLVVPRDPQRGEHVDDHQQRFSRRLAASRMVELCETEPALRAALDRVLTRPDEFRIDPQDAGAAVVASALTVGRIADGLVAAAPAARIPRQRRRYPEQGKPTAQPTPPDNDANATTMRIPVQRSAPGTSSQPAPRPDPTTRSGRVRVLYIGGWGRSGSTLTERLLGEMDELAGAGEITHLWQRGLLDNELCACGNPFRECPFWSAVGVEAFGGWDAVDAEAVLRLKHRVDRTRFVGRLALPRSLQRRRADLAAYTELHRTVYAAITTVAGADVVIDSSKHASLAFALRHDASIDLRVLHLVRDGRGVAYSWSKEVHRPEATGGDDLMPQYSNGTSGVLWSAHNALFHLLRMVHRRTRLMRYEDVIADPITNLAAVRAFLDLPPAPARFLDVVDGAPVAQVGPSHSIAGNPMRFTSGRLVLRTDSAWRTERPAKGRFLIGLLTWPGRFRYGYLDRGKNT